MKKVKEVLLNVKEVIIKFVKSISELKVIKTIKEKWNSLELIKNLKEQGVYHQFVAKMLVFIVTVLFVIVGVMISSNQGSKPNPNNPNEVVNPDGEVVLEKGPIETLIDEINVMKKSGTYSYIISGTITEGLEAHSENVSISKVVINGVESYKFEFNGYSLGENYNDLSGTYYITQIGGIFNVVDTNTNMLYQQTAQEFGPLYDRLMNQVAENRFDFGAFMYREDGEVDAKTVEENGKTYQVLTREYELKTQVVDMPTAVAPIPNDMDGAPVEVPNDVIEGVEEEVSEDVASIKDTEMKVEKITEIIKYSKEEQTVKYVKDTETDDLCIIFKVIDGQENIDFSTFTKVGN